MSGGRPSKYDPAYCEQAREWMAQGYSIAGLAGKLKVSRQTIYQWAEDHPSFSDALNEARALSAAWWEDRARDVAEKGEGNATMVVFGLKNRVADEWRDKTSHEHTGEGGGPIKTENVGSIELARRLAFLLASGVDSAE